jgi:hypothetical protein
LATVADFAVDHGTEEHARQVFPLTHVCRYWREVILSYPKIWSTISMVPGDPDAVSEWLSRSKEVPLTVLAEFTDVLEHPPCRYQNSATATLADQNETDICHRHRAVLSLNKLLPHGSRIRDLTIILNSSDQDLDDDDDDDNNDDDDNDNDESTPQLLYHEFFTSALPNLRYLEFLVDPTSNEAGGSRITAPKSLFAMNLPLLKALNYMGVNGGLLFTAKNLTSCQIGDWYEVSRPPVL